MLTFFTLPDFVLQLFVALAVDSLALILISFSLTFQTMEILKKENQKLKDENGALIRVISKLSK